MRVINANFEGQGDDRTDAWNRHQTAANGIMLDHLRFGLQAEPVSRADLPADLDGLLALHGVGPRAVRLLQQARAH